MPLRMLLALRRAHKLDAESRQTMNFLATCNNCAGKCSTGYQVQLYCAMHALLPDGCGLAHSTLWASQDSLGTNAWALFAMAADHLLCY